MIGQPELLKEIQQSFEDKKINSLCQTSDTICKVVCFPTARSLDSCLDDFYLISYKQSSEIFHKFWQEKLVQFPVLNFKDVHSGVWDKALNSCTKLLSDLKSGNMTLADIDHHFRDVYLYRCDKLRQDLINLHHGLNSVKPMDENSSWITDIVVRIGQYWDLCGYREAAEAFLKIRNTLKLTGDFAIVERVASKVCDCNFSITINVLCRCHLIMPH